MMHRTEIAGRGASSGSRASGSLGNGSLGTVPGIGILLAGAALLGACTATGAPAGSSARGETASVRSREVPRRPARVPDWANQSPSPGATAEGRAELAAWLAGEGMGYDAYWVIEAELQLAEGRARLGATEASYEASRARTAFERVLSSSNATTAQRQRARLGLDVLGGHGPPGASRLPGGVLGRQQWRARPADPGRLTPATDPWTWITVHHSAMPDAPRLDGSLGTSAYALRDIQRAQMNGSSFGDIGYHFLIDPSGRVFAGRDMRWQGAHASGDNNRGNVGICLLGNFEHEQPTRSALSALHGLIEELRATHGIARRRVKPHGYWKSTVCPGRHLLPHLARYR